MRIDGLSLSLYFVYSSSTSLFDMFWYMYDVDGVFLTKKFTGKKSKNLFLNYE